MRSSRWLNLSIVAVAIVVGLVLSVKPWRVFGEQRAVASSQSRDMRESERRQAELERLAAERSSTLGQEEQAREQGYLGPGEEPLRR